MRTQTLSSSTAHVDYNPSTGVTEWLNLVHEAINNVYDLPNIEHTIHYLHAAAGFPTKTAWLKAIHQLANVNNVNKYFTESEETQQGHMRNQRQGVRSTKIKIKQPQKLRTPLPATPHQSYQKSMTSSSKRTTPRTFCTPIRQEKYQTCQAEATSTSWYFTMSTATRYGRRP